MNVYDCLFIKPSELSVFSSDGGVDLCSQHTPTLQHQSSDSFDCTKKSILKPRKTKSLLAKFSYPKKLSQNGKFGAPKNLSIIPFTLTSEYPPPPPLFGVAVVTSCFLDNNIVFKGKRGGETIDK